MHPLKPHSAHGGYSFWQHMDYDDGQHNSVERPVPVFMHANASTVTRDGACERDDRRLLGMHVPDVLNGNGRAENVTWKGQNLTAVYKFNS